MNNKYTKELLEEKAKISFSYSELCRYLGVNAKGGTWKLIKQRIAEYNIDVSHFLGKAAYSGKRRKAEHQPWKRNASELLVDTHNERVSGRILRRAMLESNIEYKCNLCGLSNWMDTIIILEVDHIDGNSLDCRLENLQFLCPNCHSQKTHRDSKLHYIPGAPKQPRKKIAYKPKLNYPSNEELSRLVESEPLTKVAKNLGMSANGLKRHCLKNNIKIYGRGYWQKLYSEQSDKNLN